VLPIHLAGYRNGNEYLKRLDFIEDIIEILSYLNHGKCSQSAEVLSLIKKILIKE